MSDSTQVSEETPVVYVNAVRVALSFTDIRLYLGEGIPTAFADTPGVHPLNQHIIDRICVVLTPESLPQLVKGLESAIENYQKFFGQIRTPPPQPKSQPQPEPEKTDAAT